MIDKYIIIGCGGHSKVLIDTIIQNKFKIEYVVDIEYRNKKDNYIKQHFELFKIPVIHIDNLRINNDQNIMIGIGEINQRFNFFKTYIENITKNYNLLSKYSVNSKFVNLGNANFVNAGAIINSSTTIGSNCIINTNSSIDHDCVIGNNVHIAPGVSIAGAVTVGDNTFIGIGSSVKDKITIGKNVIIGSGSNVIHDIPDGKTVFGNPAK